MASASATADAVASHDDFYPSERVRDRPTDRSIGMGGEMRNEETQRGFKRPPLLSSLLFSFFTPQSSSSNDYDNDNTRTVTD